MKVFLRNVRPHFPVHLKMPSALLDGKRQRRVGGRVKLLMVKFVTKKLRTHL